MAPQSWQTPGDVERPESFDGKPVDAEDWPNAQKRGGNTCNQIRSAHEGQTSSPDLHCQCPTPPPVPIYEAISSSCGGGNGRVMHSTSIVATTCPLHKPDEPNKPLSQDSVGCDAYPAGMQTTSSANAKPVDFPHGRRSGSAKAHITTGLEVDNVSQRPKASPDVTAKTVGKLSSRPRGSGCSVEAVTSAEYSQTPYASSMYILSSSPSTSTYASSVPRSMQNAASDSAMRMLLRTT